MNIIIENDVLKEGVAGLDSSFKQTVLCFNNIIVTSTTVNLVRNSYESFMHNITCGKGYLLDSTRNLLLAVQYEIDEIPDNRFFKSSSKVIRVYEEFMTNLLYKSLYSSFKSNVLKPALLEGTLFEVVKTQSEMFIDTTDILTVPSFSSIEDYTTYCNNTINLIK